MIGFTDNFFMEFKMDQKCLLMGLLQAHRDPNIYKTSVFISRKYLYSLSSETHMSFPSAPICQTIVRRGDTCDETAFKPLLAKQVLIFFSQSFRRWYHFRSSFRRSTTRDWMNMEGAKRTPLSARKKHKRKSKRLVRSIVTYLKSDAYLYAPLFSDLSPLPPQIHTPPPSNSESSKAEDLHVAGNVRWFLN